MKNISELPTKPIEYLFTDIDDTLTLDGQLVPEAFDALWKLYDKGLKLVPITGRPAGWCELIARQWPVHGVIGENGAFYFRMKNKEMYRHFVIDEDQRNKNALKLQSIKTEVLKKIPRSKVASDQFCRLFDLAIDFAEDVSPSLSDAEVQKIVQCFKDQGAQAKVSSIHVNGWFGDYDKLSCCELFLKNEFSVDMKSNLDKLVFVGDSPNDEPMFAAFKHSVGVANINKFLKQIKTPPNYICSKEGGYGFAELAKHMLGE